MSEIRVLIVEDDPSTALAHAEFVERVPGFLHIGSASTASEARRRMRDAHAAGEPVQLLLLDLNLPDQGGLELCRELRSAGSNIDVIAVTARRELSVVRQAITIGVVQYLIKPFAFAVFAEKLRAYRDYHLRTSDGHVPVDQQRVDTAFATLRAPSAHRLPKGLSPSTLEAVSRHCAGSKQRRSASEVAQELGLSRVTARRYLEFLADAGVLVRAERYGTRGRPELEYGPTAASG